MALLLQFPCSRKIIAIGYNAYRRVASTLLFPIQSAISRAHHTMRRPLRRPHKRAKGSEVLSPACTKQLFQPLSRSRYTTRDRSGSTDPSFLLNRLCSGRVYTSSHALILVLQHFGAHQL